MTTSHARRTHVADARKAAATWSTWPLERILFALAGTVTLLSVILVTTVSPWFLALTAFVGINQWLYVAVGDCPASLLLARVTGARRCRSS